MFLLGERGKAPPLGVEGGGPAALNRFRWESDAGERSPPMVSKVTDVRLRAGQALRLDTPGGGGWGDPGRRDAGAAERDVRLGYVTGPR